MPIKLAADIGGTFTDVVLEAGDRRWSEKVPTTHGAPEAAVLEGVARVLSQSGHALSDVSLFIHGTTLATNALIERKGAPTALVTTRGFRDVLEIGNEGRFDQYDLNVVKPRPLIDRNMRFEVGERLRHDGTIVEQLDVNGMRRVAREIGKSGAAAVAISFLHAYANEAHERLAAEILLEEIGPLPVSLSHEVSPEIREYDRTSTTSANAYLQPIVSGYLLRLEARMKADGLAGQMLMILSSGSLASVRTASRFPIRLLESGPAGGAIYGCDIARQIGERQVLSFDVGGTTAKFCMIDDGEAHHALSFEVGRTYRFKKGSGLPIRIPVIDLVEIGAGGGSIARLDSVGRIAVGPDSAGSEPGPACYGRGGAEATVTDCDLLVGKLVPEGFAGGTMTLDREAATRAVAASIAGPAGLSEPNAAHAVLEIISETMASAARVHATESGTEIENRTLIAFGGGAPLQAARFAQKLGIERIVVPVGAGVGSAIGFLRAPVAFEVVRSARLTLPGSHTAAVLDRLAAMEREASDIVGAVAGASARLDTRRFAHARYIGQGHEIEVPLTFEIEPSRFAADVRTAFEQAYSAIYGRILEGEAIEVMTWTVRSLHANEQAVTAGEVHGRQDAAPSGERHLFDGESEQLVRCAVFERDALRPGDTARGPAAIVERETTTIVPPGMRFEIDGRHFIHIIQDARI
ncbi:MAG: hydantoinase/oxoprolinase family protein [Sphingopyxis sp.]|nr:hydantoinase/oxoprolinase family protein [Sphingopyxis sp.]